MALTKRQLYDYTDIDRGELKLIRIGHALWTMLRRARRQNGIHVSEILPLERAIETIMELKRLKRAELKQLRAERSAQMRQRFVPAVKFNKKENRAIE